MLHRRRWIPYTLTTAALSVVLALARCGGKSSGGDDAGGMDGALVDSGLDAAPDGGGTNPCLTDLVTDTTFDLDPDGLDTQIHAAAVFDGEAVWIAYNLPDNLGTGGFDVHAMRFNCDGTHLLPPFRVNTTRSGNDVDPDLDIHESNVYLAWASDNGTGINNMDIFYRTFNVDGTPVMTTDLILDTTRDGTPVPGNAMSPSVSALSGGVFAVAGSRGLELTGTFQAFFQKIDVNGTLIGEAIDGHVEVSVTQMYPSVAATADDTLYVAWTRSETIDDDQVVHARFAAGATTADPSPPAAAATGTEHGGADYAAERGGQGRVYLAYGSGTSIYLKDGTVFDPATPGERLGQTVRWDHTPVIAVAPGGGAVAWYRNVSGIRNDVVVQSFTFNGTNFQMGTEVVLPDGPAPPYPPAITHISGNVYFVAWSAGTSPDFRLKGRFVTLH